MPAAPPAVLHPGTLQPVGPADLQPLFPMALILQEVTAERYIDESGEKLPATKKMNVVVDCHKAIGKDLKGFGSQAKIHTRNNVGQLTGKIYFGSKQGYPEKGEKLTDYPGGYVLAYDPGIMSNVRTGSTAGTGRGSGGRPG